MKRRVVVDLWMYRTDGESGGIALNKKDAISASKDFANYRATSPIMKRLYRAGLRPLKPLEVRKLRFTITEP